MRATIGIVRVLQYDAPDSTTAEAFFAKVHDKTQWFVQQLHVGEQLHPKTLEIARLHRLRLYDKTIVHEKIASKLLFKCRPHIRNRHRLLTLNDMARNL